MRRNQRRGRDSVAHGAEWGAWAADTIVFVKRAASLLILFVVFVCVAWVVGPLCAWVAWLIAEPPNALENYWKALSKVNVLSATDLISLFNNYQCLDTYPDLTACTIFALLQVIFVAPLVGPIRLAPSGRSLRASVIVAALVAGFLFLALVGSGMEAIVLFSHPSSPPSSGFSGPDPSPFDFMQWEIGVIIVAWLICSSIMAFLLWNASHTRNPNALGRWTRRLFAGTVIELVLSIPIFLIVRRKTDCFCSLWSFGSIIIGLVGLLWLCGPAAILLATRASRRAWGGGVCGNCGYERRSASERCSECGHEFKGHKFSSQPSAGT